MKESEEERVGKDKKGHIKQNMKSKYTKLSKLNSAHTHIRTYHSMVMTLLLAPCPMMKFFNASTFTPLLIHPCYVILYYTIKEGLEGLDGLAVAV